MIKLASFVKQDVEVEIYYEFGAIMQLVSQTRLIARGQHFTKA